MGSRFVNGYRHNHTGIFGGGKTDKGSDVFVVGITPVDELARRAGFRADIETVHRTRRTGAARLGYGNHQIAYLARGRFFEYAFALRRNRLFFKADRQ
ncbi:Uncharacterised protein [Neisseria meningitidis]|nr:Uncharacterised protein [Neisseria meningitidis]